MVYILLKFFLFLYAAICDLVFLILFVVDRNRANSFSTEDVVILVFLVIFFVANASVY